jgi:hypothetical protein
VVDHSRLVHDLALADRHDDDLVEPDRSAGGRHRSPPARVRAAHREVCDDAVGGGDRLDLLAETRERREGTLDRLPDVLPPPARAPARLKPPTFVVASG